MKKKLLCLGLLLVMTFSFAACGLPESQNADNNQTNGNVETDDNNQTNGNIETDDNNQQDGVQEDNSEKPPSYEAPTLDEQTVEEFIENFDRHTKLVNNQVIIIMTEEASFEYIFHDYTAEDFPGIGVINVDPLDGPWGDTPGITHRIRQCLLEDPSGNTIPDHLKNHKRSFCITLDKEDEDNVLRAIYVLRQRDDVYLADPNWIESGDI